MVSIAHWLDTFTCSKYAERFERSGLQNINAVSQITPQQLHSLGVANNDICTIMDNVLLLKQSMKTLNTPKTYDFSSEPPIPIARSRTASPAINPLNRTMSQNPTSYSPGPNVSTPPASSGPSPDRVPPGPPVFDTPPTYHRANSYPNPVNPNTFFDISPSSSTSSPHRSTSIDALLPPPPPMEATQFNDYLPQSQPPPHQFQPPGMMYRGPNPPPPGGYYNPHQPRFYSPDQQQLQQQQQQQQQQHYMYQNQRMMMHPQQLPQQYPPWTGHRPAMPPQQMHYHPYEHHQFRMAPAQQFYQPNHPMMSDQNHMFMNQPPPPPSSQQQQQQQHQTNINSSTSSKLSPTGEPHPHPLQSLERLVLLPESQVIDPKSVVNEIHEPQSPFSESLSPFSTLSPKNSISNPTIVSNLLTNDKSIHDSHAKVSTGLKRSSTHDERNDLNKKNRLITTNDLNTGDSIINNHPVVTSLLTRGLNNSPSQAPLPSIKSLQQKHNNPSFLQQQQQQQHHQQMIYSQTQPEPQQFVDGLIDGEIENEIDSIDQNYEDLLAKLRSTIDTISKDKKFLNSKTNILPSQLDGIAETTGVTPKSNNRTSRKRDLSTSSERGTSNSENQTTPPIRTQLNKSNSDSTFSSPNKREKKRNGSLNNNHHHHHQTTKRRLSENNLEFNHSINGHHSNSQTTRLQKPKVIQSPAQSSHDEDNETSPSSSSSSESEAMKDKVTTNDVSRKPIREAKKRSLIYTGNTREFLETAIACGLIDDNGEEEDDNEYVPPGGRVNMRPTRASSSSSSSSSSSYAAEESTKDIDDENGEEEEKSEVDEDEDDNEVEEEVEDEEEIEKNSGDEMVINDEPSESGINWNVRNRPRRQTHSIRFDAISKQDEQKFFGELQEQAPELAAYLDDNSDEEYEVNEKELNDDQPKSSRKTSTTTKKSRRTQPSKDSSEHDEETVEIIKKFRHVNVPSERKSRTNDTTTTISVKNRSDELYVILNDDSPRTILSGSQLDSTKTTKKNSTIQSFQFDRRQMKINSVEDTKAPWRCIFCWKEPYEQYLGPLFGPFTLNDQCQTYLTMNKQLAKHYRKLKEIWLHRDCALWNNHIQMNPSTGELMHVSDACSTYLEITCSICQLPGAALACRYRNCKIRYHYPCVKTTVNTRLVEENYSVYCPKHNQMILNKSKVNRRKTTTSVNDSQDSTMT